MEVRLQQLEEQNVEQRRRLDEQRELVRERVARVDQKIRRGADQDRRAEPRRPQRRGPRRLAPAPAGRVREASRAASRSSSTGSARSRRTWTRCAPRARRFPALRGAGALDTFEAKQRLATLQRPDDKAAFFALAVTEDEAETRASRASSTREYARNGLRRRRRRTPGRAGRQLLFEYSASASRSSRTGRWPRTFPVGARARRDAGRGGCDGEARHEGGGEGGPRELLERCPPRSDAAVAAKERPLGARARHPQEEVAGADAQAAVGVDL